MNYNTALGESYNQSEQKMVQLLRDVSTNAYIGFGSFWGTQEAKVDEIRFYDKALSQSEVVSLYNNTKIGRAHV